MPVLQKAKRTPFGKNLLLTGNCPWYYYLISPAQMFSRILIKLIDQAIVPAILLLAIRISSIVLVSRYFGVSFDLNSSGFIFSGTTEYLLVNSYSTFVMILALFMGLFYVLLKSYVFHETHITPGMTAKLFSLKLSSFIQTSFDLYSQGAIWLSYSFLLMMVSGALALYGLLYPWVFYFALASCILSTILLVFDVENEIEITKAKSAWFDETGEYLDTEGGVKDA